MRGHFTKNDIEFIKNNYSIHGAHYCADFIKQPYWRISKKANHMGIKMEENAYLKLQKDKSGEEWEKRHGKRQQEEYQEFLNKISTPEAAYLLGFLWGDGHLEKDSNRISINITEKDGRNLKKTFSRVLNFKIKQHKCYRYNKRNKDQVTFRIINKFIYDFLLDCDYETKSYKSADKILSKIPEHLKCYWWRGFSDADGCFYHDPEEYASRFEFSSGHEQDWNFVDNLGKSLGVLFKTTRIQNKKNNKSSKIGTHRIKEIELFGNFIYQNYENDKIGLKRKYSIFKEIYYRPRKKIVE